MTGLIFNVIAYCLLSLIMILVSIKFEKQLYNTKNSKKKEIEKLRLSGSILLMIWAMFMSFYLIIDFYNILNGPLNIRLNFFETITNFLFPFFIITMALGDNIVNFLINKFKK
jgi:hypothetical protein